jgi:Protein of unknown function, DUF261
MNLPDYIIRPLIYQTDPELLVRQPIKPYGCYFMAIIEAITNYCRLPFTHEYVIFLYDKEMSDGNLGNESFVKSPQGLINDICGPGRFVFKGVQSATYVCGDDEIEWGCWHKDGNNYNHFTHNNGKGIALYDPWTAQGSDSVREGTLLSKRIAKFIA